MNTHTESFYISNLGQTLIKNTNPNNKSETYLISNYLIDNTKTSGATGVVENSIALNLNDYNAMECFIATINEGHFEVVLPKDISIGYFTFSTGRRATNWADTNNSSALAIPLIVNFHGLVGAMPRINYAYLFISEATNNRYSIYVEGDFKEGFSFNSISLFATYGQRSLLPNTDDYIAAGESIFPIDLPSNDPNVPPTFVSFRYFSSDNTATQSIVSIAGGYNSDPTICEAAQHQIDDLRNKISVLEEDISICENDINWAWEISPPSTQKRYILIRQNQIKQDKKIIQDYNLQIQQVINLNSICNLK